MKTRVGVMTFLHNDNYGSILQAWAMRQVLADLGFDVSFLDYAPDQKEKILNLLRSGNSPRLILEGMRKRSATGKMHGGFDAFRKEHVTCGGPVCRNRAELARLADSSIDVALCGSDQVWSPVWLNPAYFLTFTDKPKVAYAPSLGVGEMPAARKARRIAAMVKRFDAVSVREEEGATLIRQMAGIEPAVLPDPVMLLPRERWLTLLSDDVPMEPYLLCYFIGNAPAYWEAVQTTAAQKKLAVRVIPRTEGARQSGHTLEEDVPPKRWLALLNGASHIVTDSFHGAAFSAILNRPCTILRRYREDDPESKNSRIDQLLRTLSVPDLEAPDWQQVNARLAQGAERGKKWLLESITQAAQKASPAREI